MRNNEVAPLVAHICRLRIGERRQEVWRGDKRVVAHWRVALHAIARDLRSELRLFRCQRVQIEQWRSFPHAHDVVNLKQAKLCDGRGIARDTEAERDVRGCNSENGNHQQAATIDQRFTPLADRHL